METTITAPRVTYLNVAHSVSSWLLTKDHKRIGIIPDGVLELGRADDSSVVRAVLIQHERAFAIYAGKQNVDWAQVTSQP